MARPEYEAGKELGEKVFEVMERLGLSPEQMADILRDLALAMVEDEAWNS